MSNDQGTPVYAFGDGHILKGIVKGAIDSAVASNPMLAVAKGAIEGALKEATVSVPAPAPGATAVTTSLTEAQIEAIATKAMAKMIPTPEVQYGTGEDHWYQSRAVWSAITAIATPILALLGYNLAPEVKDCVATFGIAFGPVAAGVIGVIGAGGAALLAWWERRASKPIGATATDPAKLANPQPS